MSSQFTALDLRTLRLLSRTSFVFSTPSDPKTISFRFVLGGESLNSATRRQMRQAIQTLSKNINSVLSCDVVIRYGAPEFKSRFFRHTRTRSIIEIRKGQIFFVDILVNFAIKPSSIDVQNLFNGICNLFFKKNSLSLNQTKSDSGASIRLAFVTLPSVISSSIEQSVFVFSASNGSFKIDIQKAEFSLVKAVSDAVSTPVSIITASPKIVAKGVISSTSSPAYGVLALLSYRISQLQNT